MVSFALRVTGAFVVAILLTTAEPSHAQVNATNPPLSLAESLTGEAKAEFEAAQVLFEANDLDNALVKFQRAYDLSSDYRLLRNVASCEKRLKHYRRAQAALLRYQDAGRDKLTVEDQELVTSLLETLALFISTVPLDINEAGTTVFVDGEKMGVSPLAEPLRVDVGKRVFRFEKPGFKTFTRTESIASNATDKLVIAMEKDVHEGKLIVYATPNNAAIMIDGNTVGTGHFEGVVASGGHTLRVTAAGTMPFQTEVLVKDNDTRRIPVILTKQVDLTKWGWIGGGAAVVVVSLVVGAFVYSPTKTPEVNTSLGTFPLVFGGR